VRLRRIAGLRAYQIFTGVLFDPIAAAWHVVEAPNFLLNFVRYRRRQALAPANFRIRLRYLFPVLGDRHAGGGVASGHYFHQDIWAAREINRRNPKRHVDVGSSVAGFIAHLLSFREVEYVDIRPVRTNVKGLTCLEGSVLALPFESESIESLSSLHVTEHVGLGRYGDPVDPAGWSKAVTELTRVLKPGGVLYFSVPIGRERLEFDGHRVFDPATVLRGFASLELLSFSYVDDAGDFVGEAQPERFSGWYGCGLFLFKKPLTAKAG
jgi:SAM-dependent methyltransferase